MQLTVLNKYTYDLLPVEVSPTNTFERPYFHYLNQSRTRAETGKNLLCEMFCLSGVKPGLVWADPFGGCGLFALGFVNEFIPSLYRINDLNADCVRQIRHVLGDYPNVEISQGDALAFDFTGADIVILELPLFTLGRFVRGELKVMWDAVFAAAPLRVVVTDGGRYNYHLTWKHNRKLDPRITAEPDSYISVMSELFFARYGYSVTRKAEQSRCFYYTLEKIAPGEFVTLKVESGQGGLK